MKIAVLQHRVRTTAKDDADGLMKAASVAAFAGAQCVFMPEPLSFADSQSAKEYFFAGLEGLPGVRLLPTMAPEADGFAATAPPIGGIEELGRIALLAGDACMTGVELVRILGDSPDVAVLAPRAENDLQAEAILELAIGLSESLASLVIITECAGAEAGKVGHGGSAIVYLGKVLAESIGQDDDMLMVDIETPLSRPEPPEPLPTIAPILRQRVAFHRGEHVPEDFPTDL